MARSQMSAKKPGEFDPNRSYTMTESEWHSSVSAHNLLRHLVGLPLGVNVEGFWEIPKVATWKYSTSQELGKLLLRAISESIRNNYILRHTQDWILGVRYGRYNGTRETLEQLLVSVCGANSLDWKTATAKSRATVCTAIRDLYPYDPKDIATNSLHIPYSTDVVALLEALKKYHSDIDERCNRCDDNGLYYKMESTSEFRKPSSDVLMAYRCTMCKGSKHIQSLAPSQFDPFAVRALADACEESGTDPRIVQHLRAESSHFLGCWAVRELGKATKAWILEC